MAYVLRIGGDLFEYRPLDFYWPLLAVPAADGIAHLGARIAAGLRRMRRFPWRVGARAWAVAIFVPVLFYASALQDVLLFEDAATHTERDEENAGWLLAVPGMPALMAISNDLRRQSARNKVGQHFWIRRNQAGLFLHLWMPYEQAERGVIPGDAVMAGGGGIMPYYVPDLEIIDQYGLTDATVARNPATMPNYERQLAHDRRPPPGYLQQRGVNFSLHAAATSEVAALAAANYALQVGPDLWMPFDVADHQWANERFAGRNLRARSRFSLTDPAGNRLRVGDPSLCWGAIHRPLRGRPGRLAGRWRGHHQPRPACVLCQGQDPIFGHVGPGFLTSYHPDEGDKTTGKARSPEFTASDNHHLAFLIGGGAGSNVGVRLLADGQEVVVWRGRNNEHFKLIAHPLAAVAGKPLQLELFDNDPAGHIMLDHVLLMREIGTRTAVADARPEAS